MSNQIVLIDFSSMAFKEFHALKELKNKDGVGTGMALGFLKQIFMLMVNYSWRMNQIILILDGKPTFKYQLFPGYKSGRKKLDLPEAMKVPIQLKITKLVLSFFGFKFYINESEEADSTIAYLAKTINEKSKEKQVIIVSNDHDMYQCLNANTSLLVSQQNAGYQIYTERVFYSTYGIQPSEYWRVQTLAGCTTDTVPGLRGISETTAVEIIKLNDWDKIINNDKDLKFPTKRSETAFRKGFINWERERDEKLTRLVCDGKGIKVLKNIRNEAKIREWFLKLEFKQFLSPSSFTRLLEVIK